MEPADGSLSPADAPLSVPTLFSLEGKVAIVTGASSGLGVTFAHALAQAGADVAIGARREDRLAATGALVEASGRRSLAVATDVADPAACRELVSATLAELGRVDILINNAGVGTAVPASRETPEQFSQVMQINVNGSYWMAQACAEVMEPGSAIVNVSSVVAQMSIGLPQAAYSASKAAVCGLTRDLAAQWTPRKGIRVNAVAPGLFASEMTDQFPDGFIEAQLPRILSRRAGDATELAATVVFLASPAAGYITGQTITVDGGLSIT